MQRTASQRLNQDPKTALRASLEQLEAWQPELSLAARNPLAAIQGQTSALAREVLLGPVEGLSVRLQQVSSHGGNLLGQIFVPGEYKDIGTRVRNFLDWQARWSRLLRDISLVVEDELNQEGAKLEEARKANS